MIRLAPEQLHFRVNCVDEANALVRRFHYSARPPANIQVVGTWHQDGGLFGDAGDAVAACYFCLPPTRWKEPVLELSRLVRREDAWIDLTALVSLTCHHIRMRKVANLLVSFADQTQGHHGGIYQAASWNYDGCRKTRMDGVIWNGAFIPGRSANSRWGTQSPQKLREILGGDHTIEPHFDQGKHLYWRALNKNGRKQADRLGLKSIGYPKPKQKMEAAE